MDTSSHGSADDTFVEEYLNIKLRREALGTNGKPLQGSLVGLALSGGGIRSATFGLGVLQAMKEQDLLKRVDYLSTVSGGGYIGAWLSANCKRAAGRKRGPFQSPGEAAAAAAAAECLDPKTSWNESIAHLRRYSNYLSPSVGLLSADSWSMVTTWLRNTLLLQVTVFLAIAALLLLPRILFPMFESWPAAGHWRWTTVALFILAIVGIGANQWRMMRTGQLPLLQRRYWLTGLIGALACAYLARRIALHYGFEPFSDGRTNWLPSLLVGPLCVITGVFLLPVGLKITSPAMAFLSTVLHSWKEKERPQSVNYDQGWVQWLIVLPLLATGFLMAAILWGQTVGAHVDRTLQKLDTYSGFLTTAWNYWPFPLSIAFMSLWVLTLSSLSINWLRLQSWRTWELWRGVLVALLAPIPAVLVLHALLSGIMLLMHHWASSSQASELAAGPWLPFIWGPALVLYAFSLSIVMLIGMMGRELSDGVREWWARLGAWMLIYGAAWMLIALAATFGPLLALMLVQDEPNWKSLSAVGGWLLTTVGGLLAGRAGSTGGRTVKSQDQARPNRVLNAIAIAGPYVFMAGLLIGLGTVLHLFLLNLSMKDCCDTKALYAHYWNFMSLPDSSLVILLADAIAAIVLLLAARVDINVFSLNAFYSARLARCYLGAARFQPGERQPQKFTQFDDLDDLPLSSLGGNAHLPSTEQPIVASGPVHIVNCALNLGGASDLSLHTRQSASFTLTPYRAGSSYLARTASGAREPLGYRPVNTSFGPRTEPSLGQAISISGAAASPNMGYHTSTAVAFLLTVFNVRLGWWFPSPKNTKVNRPSPIFSMRYLIKELFGNADDQSNYLMLSDGGHFENLGVYELVRRQCRVIIVSDAECDPHLNFEALGTLIRMCKVDFDVDITLDTSAIRAQDNPEWSEKRFAAGTIKYGNGVPDGILIYIKASMTGAEDASVLQYLGCHSLFPHESTGDQFYGEDQFESYRRLGHDIGSELFKLATMNGDMVAYADALQRRIQSPGTPSVKRIGPDIARPAHRIHPFHLVRGGRHTP
jgi:hypothetical protein